VTYSVKEIFYTLQGEGAHVGRPAVFCRFTGCNLWSGREQDRSKAICQFCDTDFIGTNGPGGGKFENAQSLAQTVKSKWPINEDGDVHPFVVCTGGEPLLQLDTPLVEAFHEEGIEVAIETNGTCHAPVGLDWICVSPKADAEIVIQHGDELKLVFPQAAALPKRFEHLDFNHFFLQPMDGPDLVANTKDVVEYCKSNPKWRLSLQIHKVLDIP